MTWYQWLCTLFGCVLIAFAIIGFFEWLGLIQFTPMPCPCQDGKP